jgi:hypothetical protein
MGDEHKKKRVSLRISIFNTDNAHASLVMNSDVYNQENNSSIMTAYIMSDIHIVNGICI